MNRHASQIIGVVGSVVLLLCSRSGLADKGRWTQPEDWSGGNGTYAVHLALLRGDSNPDHSRLLYWVTSNSNTFFGQERGWSPANGDCNSSASTGFTFRGAPVPTFGIFCAGHTQLADSRRLLVNGGTLPYGQNFGERRNAIFTAGSGTSAGSWSETGTMYDGRWYPTAVSLIDGRVLTISGDRYPHLRAFGGTRGGSLPGSSDVEGDSVLRFGFDPGGRWDPSVLPAVDGLFGTRPQHRQRLSVVDMQKVSGFGGQVFFGGLGASQSYDEAWLLSRSDGAVQAGDYDYQWTRILPVFRPDPRSDPLQ